MSGRNKPSYDFLLKLLQRFPQINPDWLLLDRGPMYRDEIKNKTHAAPGGSAVPATSPASAVPTAPAAPTLGTPSAPLVAPSAETGLSKGLFDPDNNDIIPSAVHSGGHSTGHPTGYSTEHPQGGHTGGRAAEPPRRPLELKGAEPGGQFITQNPVYQSNGFAKSSTIERIVVFYKDKTFSEYQPE
jgi:hypothetical protein